MNAAAAWLLVLSLSTGDDQRVDEYELDHGLTYEDCIGELAKAPMQVPQFHGSKVYYDCYPEGELDLNVSPTNKR